MINKSSLIISCAYNKYLYIHYNWNQVGNYAIIYLLIYLSYNWFRFKVKFIVQQVYLVNIYWYIILKYLKKLSQNGRIVLYCDFFKFNKYHKLSNYTGAIISII